MGIFGDVRNATTGELIYEAGPTDLFVSITFSTLLILFFLVSIICNPLVFFSHRRGKQNVSSILFEVLSANDLLTCLVSIPPILWFIATDDALDCSYDLQRWFTVIRNTLFTWSICITAVLGVVRGIKINMPLVMICKGPVFGSLGLFMVLSLAGNVWRVLTEELKWNVYTQQVVQWSGRAVITSPSFICNLLLYVILVGISIASCFWSMYGLHMSHLNRLAQGMKSGNECPACFTVALINLINLTQFLLTVAFLALSWTNVLSTYSQKYLDFIQFPLANTANSACNPLIIVTRSGELGRVWKRHVLRSTTTKSLMKSKSDNTLTTNV